jgi:cytochrome P450
MAAVAEVPRHEPEVHPSIVRVVGDVSRPDRAPALSSDLGHIPGRRPGIVSAIAWLNDYMRRGVDAVADHERRYGTVSRVPYRGGSAVMVCDPDAIMRIARNAEQAWSSALAWTAFFDGIDLRDFVLMLDFERHRDARKRLQPAFTPAALDGYMKVAVAPIDEAVGDWLAAGRVAFKREVRALLASVSSRIFLGDLDAGPMLDAALAETWMAPYALFRNALVSPTWRRGVRGHHRLTEALRAMVPARRGGGHDLFSRLCADSTEASGGDDDFIVRSFIGVMLGAFDTTSAGLTSMAYLLARHPEWQERMRAEAVALGTAPLTLQRAQGLDATDRCWKETLRLFPVVSGLPRCALRDVEVGGHRIPAGALVFAMLGPAQRSSDAWTSPATFDPDRFSEERAEDKRRPGLFMPFGAGPHACIGSMLSTLEVKAFWHVMLPRCRFRLERDYAARHTYGPMGCVSGDVRLVVERTGSV